MWQKQTNIYFCYFILLVQGCNKKHIANAKTMYDSNLWLDQEDWSLLELC